MTEMNRIGDVKETELTADDVVEKTVAELVGDLSSDGDTVLISRGGESRIPLAEDVLEDSDHITLIGRKEAVRDAIFYCHQSDLIFIYRLSMFHFGLLFSL